jgi:hypothetical protein
MKANVAAAAPVVHTARAVIPIKRISDFVIIP